jgi:hypothetical protein
MSNINSNGKYKKGQIMFIVEPIWLSSSRERSRSNGSEYLLWNSLRDGRFHDNEGKKFILAVVESEHSYADDVIWYNLCRMFPYYPLPCQPHHFDCSKNQIISVFEICCCFFSEKGKYSSSVKLNCDTISHILKFLYPQNPHLDHFLYKYIKTIVDSDYSKEYILDKPPCAFVPDYFSNLV